MLPAWATVAIALGASAITAVAALGATWLRIRFERRQDDARRMHDWRQQEAQLEHEREEAWRDRMVRAADDFSTGVEQALLAVNDAISAVTNRADRSAIVEEAHRTIREAVARVGRIRLLFGEESRAVAVARDLLPELRLALSQVEGGGAEVHARVPHAWKTLEKAYEHHREFNRAAREAITSVVLPRDAR